MPRPKLVRRYASWMWRLAKLTTALAAIPLLLWACNSHPLEKPTPKPEQQTTDRFFVNPIRDVDMLFVIDTSGSTNNKQQNFAQNFPAFMNALQMIPGGLPNIRIAVINSDIGAGGATTTNMCAGIGTGGKFSVVDSAGANCGIANGDQWITPTNLVPGRTLEQVFACMATRAVVGCGYEHQLQAANVALHPRPDWNPMNAGFLRPEAYLAIIWLTDEDDCSAPETPPDFFAGPPPAGFSDNGRCSFAGHLCNNAPLPAMATSFPLSACLPNPNPTGLLPVQQIVNDIQGLKPGHPEKIVVAAIAGWPSPGAEGAARYTLTGGAAVNLGPVCNVAGGGTPALRIKSFLDSFPNSGLHTICQNNYAGALAAIGQLVGAVVGSPCLSQPLMDMDLMMPGMQPDCAITDKVGDVTTALPRCGTGPQPCWRVDPAPTCANSGYQITIDRGMQPAPQGLEQVIKCRTCVNATDPGCRR